METLKILEPEPEPELMTSLIANDIFKYDAGTGKLFWKIKASYSVDVGDEIKGEGKYGHLRVRYKGKPYYVHRIIWLMSYGTWPDGDIDHIDHNPKNNKLENLRDVTASSNHRNKSIPTNNTSGFVGVSFNKKSQKWRAMGTGSDGIRKYLGSFDRKEDAIEARKTFNRDNDYHTNHGS